MASLQETAIKPFLSWYYSFETYICHQHKVNFPFKFLDQIFNFSGSSQCKHSIYSKELIHETDSQRTENLIYNYLRFTSTIQLFIIN